MSSNVTFVPDTTPLKLKADGTQETLDFQVDGIVNKIEANHFSRILDDDGQTFSNWYDIVAFSIVEPANGSLFMFNPLTGDVVTINNIDYIAKNEDEFTGAPGEFIRLPGNQFQNAINLAEVINNDTRVGTLGFVTAASDGAFVFLTSSLPGSGGNGTVLTSEETSHMVPDPLAGIFYDGVINTNDVNLIHKTVRVSKDLDATIITDFFDNFRPDGLVKNLVVIPLRTADTFIEYSIFFFWEGATGNTKMDLYFGTVEVEEGKTPLFPKISTDSPYQTTTLVARSMKGGVGSTTNPPTGLTRVYDYFVIAQAVPT